MITLLEAAKLETNPIKRGVVEIFARSSEVMTRLPFWNTNSLSFEWVKENSLPEVNFRGLNEDYSESQGTYDRLKETLFPLGGKSRVDRLLAQHSPAEVRSRYDSLFAKAIALKYTRQFFKGDNSANPKEFDGLENRLTGDQVIDLGDELNPSTATMNLAKVDELIDLVQGGPDVLFMNKFTSRAIDAAVRAQGQSIETVTDQFGRRLSAYAGIPKAIIEDDAAGNPILGFDEGRPNDPESRDCTSIYAVRFGAGEWVSGLQVNLPNPIDQGLVMPHFVTYFDWACGLTMFHPKAAARLRGFRQA
jgi:hypothetical protein